jgi:sulfite reductase (NADPH) flavoprotein alpha-component
LPCPRQGGAAGALRAGDLLGIVPPGSSVPRYYSLASGWHGFVEICVRQMPGGLCSTHLLGLQPGGSVQAFIRPNPGFARCRARGARVLLIGAGTGVAPLAGFIRRNDRHKPMHLYFGGRDPARDDYFGPRSSAGWPRGAWPVCTPRCFRASRGAAAMCRTPCAATPHACAACWRTVPWCACAAAGHGTAEWPRRWTNLLAPLHLSVQQLKAEERYAEDLF